MQERDEELVASYEIIDRQNKTNLKLIVTVISEAVVIVLLIIFLIRR